MKNHQQLIQRFRSKFKRFIKPDHADYFLLEKFEAHIIEEVERAEKAYGGCHNCYGKGYSTYRHGYTGMGDFEGDPDYSEQIKTHMVFCECDRGKQLKELLNSLKQK